MPLGIFLLVTSIAGCSKEKLIQPQKESAYNTLSCFGKKKRTKKCMTVSQPIWVESLTYADSENLAHLESWKTLSQYDISSHTNPQKGGEWMHLVHMIRDPKSELNKLHLEKPFSESIANWDVFSTSLVSNQNSSSVIGYFGFILDVPVENIISTNQMDIGLRHQHCFANGEFTSYGKGKLDKEIRTPATILKNTGVGGRYPHNEIVLAARPGMYIRTQAGMPTTSSIMVKGIYALTGHSDYKPYHDMAEKIAELNKVPIIYIQSDRKPYTG